MPLYARRSIPWSDQPDGTHQISVAGGPRPTEYLYQLTSQYRSLLNPPKYRVEILRTGHTMFADDVAG